MKPSGWAPDRLRWSALPVERGYQAGGRLICRPPDGKREKVMNGRRYRLRAGLVILLLVSAITAVGQTDFKAAGTSEDEGDSLKTGTVAVDTPAGDSLHPQLLSEKTALSRSLTGTLVPTVTIVLAVPGLIIGPSLGYFYAGLPRRAWTGIGLRFAGIGGMVSSFAICGWDCGPGDDSYDLAWVVFISGAALTAGSAVYDIATVEGAVRRKNEALLSASMRIVPAYFADAKAVGLKVEFFF